MPLIFAVHLLVAVLCPRRRLLIWFEQHLHIKLRVEQLKEPMWRCDQRIVDSLCVDICSESCKLVFRVLATPFCLMNASGLRNTPNLVLRDPARVPIKRHHADARSKLHNRCRLAVDSRRAPTCIFEQPSVLCTARLSSGHVH